MMEDPVDPGHECNYKALYTYLLDELRVARKELAERDAIILECYEKMPEHLRLTMRLPQNMHSRTPIPFTSTSAPSRSSLSHPPHTLSSPSSSKPSPSSITTKTFSKTSPSKYTSKASKTLSNNKSTPSTSFSTTSTSSTKHTQPKSSSSSVLPPLDSRYSTLNLSLDSPEPIHTTTASQPKKINPHSTTSPSLAKRLSSKPRVTKAVSTNSVNSLSSISLDDDSSDTDSDDFLSQLPTTSRIQVESDEVYARILQDIEEKKAVERGRQLLSTHTTPRFGNSTPRFSNPHYQVADPTLNAYRSYVLGSAMYSPRAFEEIGTSYEELSRLEDVCTGIPEDQIDSIISKQIVTETFENSKCPVCLDEYQIGDEFTSLPCAHVFHYSCMRRCLSVKKTCPLCKVYVI